VLVLVLVTLVDRRDRDGREDQEENMNIVGLFLFAVPF